MPLTNGSKVIQGWIERNPRALGDLDLSPRVPIERFRLSSMPVVERPDHSAARNVRGSAERDEEV